MFLGLVDSNEELELFEDIAANLLVAYNEGLLDIFIEEDASIERGWTPNKYKKFIEEFLTVDLYKVSNITSLCSKCNRPLMKDWLRCPFD